MENGTRTTKTCALCGMDCSCGKRVRDTRGTYYCADCYERARDRQRSARSQSEEQSAMIAQAIAETPATSQCPRCAAALMPGAVLCTNCGLDQHTGRSHGGDLAMPVGGAAPAPAPLGGDRWERMIDRQRGDAERAARLEYIIPAVLLVLGLGGVFALLFMLNGNAVPSTLMTGYLIGLGIEVVVGVIGLFVAARLWLGGAGPLGLGILRLAGIYAFVDVVTILVAPLLAIGWVIRVAVYVSLLSRLFDFDLRDSAMIGIITYALKIGVGIGMAMMLIGA